MRKYLFIFTILISFMGLHDVDAASFNDVVNELKRSDYYNSMNQGGVNANISSTNNSLTISYIDEESNAWQTSFTYANDIISYTFKGDKNSDTTLGQTIVDAIWINEITKVVGSLNGFQTKEVSDWMQKMTEKSLYAMNTIGVEYTSFDYNYENDTSMSLSGTSFDTFKIKLNGFNIKADSSNTSNGQVESTTQFDTVQNPKTGIKENFIAFLSTLIIGITSIYKLNNIKIYKKL